MAARLGAAQFAALEQVAWGTRHFGALVTSRNVRLDTVHQLHKRGLVESAGLVAVCDGDGFLLQPGRYREAWKLTAAGKQVLSDFYHPKKEA